MKVKIIIAVIVIAIGAVLFGLWKAGLLIPKERVSVVEDTPNIVEAVEQIQELCTEYYYDEVMVKDSVVKTGVKAAVANTVNSVVESTGNFFSNLFGSKKEETATTTTTDNSKKTVSSLEKELVVIVKVTCRVGWDLKELVDSNGMQVCGDTLFIDLPKAKFLETIANPTDINIFVEDGEWPFPIELQNMIRHAKSVVEQRAINDSIFAKADVSGRKILSNLFSTMGFTVIFTDEVQNGIPLQQPSEAVKPADTDSTAAEAKPAA